MAGEGSSVSLSGAIPPTRMLYEYVQVNLERGAMVVASATPASGQVWRSRWCLACNPTLRSKSRLCDRQVSQPCRSPTRQLPPPYSELIFAHCLVLPIPPSPSQDACSCTTTRGSHVGSMNLLLSDPEEAIEYIEQITNTNTIRSGHATCLRFNRTGDFLASGRVDGTVVVWDIETMGVARKMRGHHRSITSLSWSGCGRYLLSACQGWKVILWDLLDGKKDREVRFRAPAYIAELHPFNP